MTLTIITNNQPRNLISGYELTDKERAEFDYYSPDDLDMADFVRYRGQLYDCGEFMRASSNLKPWDGILADTFFSGVLVRYMRDGESVIMARCYS